MAVELATGYVSLVPETSTLAREAGRAFDRVANDLQRRFARAFNDSGQALEGTFARAGQSAGQAGGRAAARGFSSQLNQIDASAFNRIARGAEGAGEEIRRLNRWQLNDLIREANRAGQQLGSEIPAGAGNAERALRRLDAQGLENLLRSAREAQRALGRVDDEAAQATRSAGSAARAAGADSGQQAAEGMGDKLANLLGGKAGIIGSTVAAAFSLAGFTAGGLFVKAIQRGMEQEQALDLAQARLGVDDAVMHRIGTAAGRAYAGAFGESVEENVDTARRAIQSGLLDPNATAQETQQVIQQLSGISQLMGEEIPAVSRAAGQAIKTGIAGSATEAFDLFATAERNGLNVSEDFLDTITEYGTQFRKLGLSGPEAIGLINQAVKAGARDSDIAADAIKEFAIRVVDGSDSTVEAFQTLGFEADDLTAKFSQGGSTARAAVGDLLAKIREIEDPVERNKVALALFGTQFEDLGDALNQFNLDTAVNSLGQVAGAAQNALNAVGGNAATSIEGAKRSIETSADAIGAALAKAFGPELAKVADWVTKHQPEILGFMGKLADGAIATADAFLSFASISLNAFADLAEGVGPILEQTLDPIGKVAEVIGKLTGSEGLEDLGHTLQEMENTMRGAADGARDIADGIDNSARPSLDRMRASVAENIAETRHAAEVTRALGDTVTALPDGHDIIIKENTPEVQARLEALGFRVTHMEDGQFRVEANTAEAQQRLNDFINTNSGKAIPVEIMASLSAQSRALNAEVDRASRAQPGTMAAVPHYARGTGARGVVPALASGGLAGRTLEGRLWGPGNGRSDSILGIGPDGIPTALVSAGEGVINAAAMARNGVGDLVAALNRGWVPPADYVRDIVRGGARLWHGNYDGSLRALGIEEDNPLVAGSIGLRDLLVNGDYTSSLRDTLGVEEDNPLISAALGLRSLAHGNYDSRLRDFGIEEDSPLVAAGIGAGALLMRGDYNPNLRQFGIEEDDPIVDAGIGVGALMRGDYAANLRRLGIEEDDPLVGAALGARNWLANLPNFAEGGVVPGKRLAQSLDPAKYQMGGFSTSAIDCSGLVSAVVNDALGKPAFSSRMSTVSEGQWLAALGAKPGLGGPGDISVGWYDNGGGANGHTAMTLGDGTNVESNGSEGVVVGGKVGANHPMFTQRMHIPAALLRGGDLGGPATGAPGGAGARPGGSGGAGTGGLGGGAAAGAAGGTFGGVEVPAGVTPVWIVGSNVAGASGSSSAAAGSSSSPSTTAAPSESFAPQASTQPAPMPDIGARALQAGGNFLNANLDQFLGDIGLRREGGAIQALAKVIFDAMARATSEAVAQATRNPGSLIRHAGRPF